MNALFIERLNDLTLLSQNHSTSDIFEKEYLKLLQEVQDQMRALKTLILMQQAWLQTERDIAMKKEGLKEQ
jgi:uncharacterized protein YecT (DUF1311 family)